MKTIKLILLAAIMAAFLSVPVMVYGAEGDYTGVHWNTDGQTATPYGTTTDGTNIWVIDNSNTFVYKYTMAGAYTGFTFVVSGQEAFTRGITTDGTFIWIVGLTDDVHRFHMNGTYIDQFDQTPANDFSSGITTDGTYLWIVDGDEDEVYKYRTDGTFITPQIPFEPQAAVEKPQVRFAEDILVSGPTKPETKSKKRKKKGTKSEGKAQDGIRLKKQRRESETPIDDDEEEY